LAVKDDDQNGEGEGRECGGMNPLAILNLFLIKIN